MSDFIIIDTDPGIDDSLAFVYAYARNLPVKNITTVYGNSTLSNVTRNAGFIIKSLGSEWSLHKGRARPLTGKARLAESHGNTGLGDTVPKDSEILFPSTISAEKLFDALALSDQMVTLLCLGPLTNIAYSLDKNPDLIKRISRIIIMGGAFTENGNVTAYAEFNVYNDPSAFRKVIDYAYQNGVDTTVIPVELCRQILLTDHDLNNLEGNSLLLNVRQIVEPFIRYYVDDATYGGYEGAVLYDVLVPLYCEFPSLFEVVRCRISVEERIGEYYGKTIFKIDAASSVKICTTIQVNEAKETILRALSKH